MALSNGVDAKILSSMLGYCSAGFALDTCTHVINEMQRGTVEKSSGFMEIGMAHMPNPPEGIRSCVVGWFL